MTAALYALAACCIAGAFALRRQRGDYHTTAIYRRKARRA